MARDALVIQILFPLDRVRSLTLASDWVCQLRWANKNPWAVSADQGRTSGPFEPARLFRWFPFERVRRCQEAILSGGLSRFPNLASGNGRSPTRGPITGGPSRKSRQWPLGLPSDRTQDRVPRQVAHASYTSTPRRSRLQSGSLNKVILVRYCGTDALSRGRETRLSVDFAGYVSVLVTNCQRTCARISSAGIVSFICVWFRPRFLSRPVLSGNDAGQLRRVRIDVAAKPIR